MNDQCETGPEAVLRRAAERSGGRLHDRPTAPSGAFQPLSDLTNPEALFEVLHRLGQTPVLQRLGQSRPLDDPVLVGSALLKDLLFLATSITIETLTRERRVLDVSLANLLVDVSTARPRLALLQPLVAVIEGDDLEGALVVPDESALLQCLDEWLLDDTARRLIAGLRSVARVGEHHLWGNIAVIVADTLNALRYDPSTRADHDRDVFFVWHPELAAHIEMMTVIDGQDGPITLAIRRNCCLRVKLPDVAICFNCNLLQRDECIQYCAAHYRSIRGGPNDPFVAVPQLINEAMSGYLASRLGP